MLLKQVPMKMNKGKEPIYAARPSTEAFNLKALLDPILEALVELHDLQLSILDKLMQIEREWAYFTASAPVIKP